MKSLFKNTMLYNMTFSSYYNTQTNMKHEFRSDKISSSPSISGKELVESN